MNDQNTYKYPECVCSEIDDQKIDSYRQSADYINVNGYDVLSVQHEYGIFGGEAGGYLMNLVREAKMPIVTTLHTVLQEPSEAQKLVMDELLQLSERVVVMSEKAVGFLIDVHNVCSKKIDLIPHGIPLITETTGNELRKSLNIDGPMILTFGLLSPDKGIQYVIEAMPKIVADHPGATYVVVGATHPHITASQGEAYRDGLIQLAADLGVSNNVRFVDRFVTIDELVEYLGAMDIYITPYLNPKQITSGTLAYSVGAGKAVISTPYWYAEELLSDGKGMIIPFRDADSIANAVLSLEANPEMKMAMGVKAGKFGKQMLWPAVGKRYLASFAKAKRDSADRLRSLVEESDIHPSAELPELAFSHLFTLSDDTGILQHATYTIPNRSEGYCVDDNARALLFTVLYGQDHKLSNDVLILQSRYLSFMMDAFNPQNGRFRNFMNFQRNWLEESGSEDSHGRSLWCLATTVNRCQDLSRREVAKNLFSVAAPALYETTSLRTWAYGVLAADEYLKAFPHDHSVQILLQTMASRILRQYEYSQAPEWPWFEETLTYANARISQALIVAGEALGNFEMQEIGFDSLNWLMKVQTSFQEDFAPIGSEGFYPKGGERSYFDQQPIEAWASVSACLTANRVSRSAFWHCEAHRAFNWFRGGNMLGLPVYDEATGGCHDGLHSMRLNRNQGAESTLSYLCALTELRQSNRPSGHNVHKVSAYEIK